MDDLTRGHPEIVEQLPDYAGGALDDAELDRIAAHLEACPDCRRELGRILELVGMIGEVFPPERVRADILRIATEPPVAPPLLAPPPLAAPAVEGAAPRRPVFPTPVPAPAPVPVPDGAAMPAVPTAVAPTAGSAPTPGRVLQPSPSAWRRAALATLAAAAVLLAALGFWTLRLQQEVADQAAIAALVAGATVSPLTDGELFPAAAGALFSASDRRQALLVADGLPPLPPDRSYQIWLFDDEGGRTAGQRFAVDAAGRAEVVVEAPEPFAAYGAVAISAEPAGGSQEPTSALALGGWIR